MHISASEKTNIDKLVDANIIDVGFDLGVTNQSKPRRPWQKAAGFCGF